MKIIETEKIITAALVGISLDRLLRCSFFVFGLASIDKIVAIRFIIGRIGGFLLLGLLMGSLGSIFHISGRILNFILGVIVLGFGLWSIIRTESKVKELTRKKVGFGLGFFKAIMPGPKVAILLPLVWGSNITTSILICVVYALTSSLYLLIAFLSANVLTKIIQRKKIVKVVGGSILIGMGIYYIIKSFLI